MIRAALSAVVLGMAVTLVLGGCAVAREPLALDPTPTATATPTLTPTPTPTPTFNTALYSIDDPTSLWVIVNKTRPMNPITYIPSDLLRANISAIQDLRMRAEVGAASEAMFAAAQSEAGISLSLLSAFRSFEAQTRIYNGWVGSLGQEGADLTSARPGHSEHQTGLAIDLGTTPALCSLDPCFATTPAGEWLAANAHRFGFILRYSEGSTPITGYEFEPWHYRYVGLELAAELNALGNPTLEEFFGLPPAPDYVS